MSNFSAVEQANGNLTMMFGVFTEIGGATVAPSGKTKSLCKLRDDAGVEHKVHIHQGTGQLPSPQQLNQRCQFNLSTFQGTYQNTPYTGYSGFWNSTASVAPPAAPQNASQPASQPAQAAKQPDDSVWDAKDLRAAKLSGIIRAVERDMAYQSKKTIAQLKEEADEWVEFQYSPRIGSDESPHGVDEDGVPF